jgi:two-component system response regulator FixJ
LPGHFPVYVIDDDPSVREWAELMCQDLGLGCRTFSGGGAFLEAFSGLEPGCILLDMRMPMPNGLAVQAELVARGNLMPVIAMTGYGDVDVAVQSMRLGATEFLEKPFTQEVLEEALKNGLRQLRQSSDR